MNFYQDPLTSREDMPLQQGDILGCIPFLSLTPTQAEVLGPKSEATSIVDLTAKQPCDPGTRVCVDFEVSDAIVISQTCDLGKMPYFLVARVVPWELLIKAQDISTPRGIRGKISQLANPGRYSALFYLPGHKSANFVFPKSLAVFYSLQALDTTDMDAVQNGCFKLRLSPVALQAFQERLAYFFGRFGAPEHLYYTEEEWLATNHPG